MQLKSSFNFFYVYYFGLIMLVVGLPLSVFLMSISQFIMLGAWLLSGNLAGKIRSFFSNRTALIISSVFVLHLIGLLYTTDLDFGLRDVKIKIPLLLLPLVISTMPSLSSRQLRWLLYFFCAAVFAGTLIGSAIMLGLGKKSITDARQASVFISHIRFSLMICFAVFILAWYAWLDRSAKKNIIYFSLAAWFIVFMILLESLTGIIVLLITAALLATYFIFKRTSRFIRAVYIICLCACGTFFYYVVHRQVNDFFSVSETADLHHLDSLTAHGHPYLHDLKNNTLQNGNYTGIYQCWEEMEPAWNKRSKINFMGNDNKGNQVRFTLIRYLTSKGLRKDGDGINALSGEDIHNIENGIPDQRYTQMPTLRTRVEGIIWEFNEYCKGKDPSGHSVTQRLEFWRTALGIIRKNILFGVGTGDPGIAFREEYKINGTLLKEKYRLRSHNQFLAIAVAFGLPGLFWFLFTLFYPLASKRNRRNFLYVIFFIIALLSMINEDTLETQAGVTFFAFFNSLLLFSAEDGSERTV